jgi:hypothetical protein
MSDASPQQVSALDSCPKCSAPVFGEAHFCSQCGRPVGLSPSSDRVTALRDFATGALEEAENLVTQAIARPDVKKIAGGAVVGMGIGIALPIVTAGAGAVLGAKGTTQI